MRTRRAVDKRAVVPNAQHATNRTHGSLTGREQRPTSPMWSLVLTILPALLGSCARCRTEHTRNRRCRPRHAPASRHLVSPGPVYAPRASCCLRSAGLVRERALDVCLVSCVLCLCSLPGGSRALWSELLPARRRPCGILDTSRLSSTRRRSSHTGATRAMSDATRSARRTRCPRVAGLRRAASSSLAC